MNVVELLNKILNSIDGRILMRQYQEARAEIMDAVETVNSLYSAHILSFELREELLDSLGRNLIITVLHTV
jgi:hypothetical protein